MPHGCDSAPQARPNRAWFAKYLAKYDAIAGNAALRIFWR
jgi:hypothetical protein